MASIRAFVRCRTSLPGNPVEVITDVNAMLCRDTEQSGSFISLFYLIIDRSPEIIRWIRCGHDPAIVYDPGSGEFSELRGEGLVLGFDSNWQYREYNLNLQGRDMVILVGSDGVWEAENDEGERFGRERVKKLMSENAHLSSAEITTVITREVTRFRGKIPQADDITLVVVKMDSGQ
jgi:sigma-B regulation protein RsbU (phosphoserine phosphatase)